jgi:multidrug efflux pump subunit AcrA (membrane-fusion protein)
MELNDDGLKIYSEEVRDILSDPPKTILRWGNTILFGFVAVILLLTWIIKYPDIVSSQIIITTKIPPQRLVAKTNGKIEIILVKDKSYILKNTPIAVIENSANYKQVFLLKSIVDTINIERSRFPFEKLQAVQLGEIENSFAVFQKEYMTNQLNLELQPYKVEGIAQSNEAIQLRNRLNLLESQKLINQSELELQKNDVERYKTLYDKGIIATQEFERQKLTYLQSQKNYKNLLNSISQLESSIIELTRNSQSTKINENKENINLERNVLQAFFQLKKSIKDWELNYVLRSGIDGKLSYLQLWSKNQNVNTGDNIFSIIPKKDQGFIGKARALALNSGKIKVGQNVNIRLANYPDREFGMLVGRINAISLTPDREGNLLIDVSIPNGLKTTYRKQIYFQQEMTGTADIITEDLRLIERLFYQFKDLFIR